jgi:hypothetical protein
MTQAINLANFANNLDTSGNVNPSVLNAPVPLSKGGTGATTAAAAATALATAFGNLLFPVGSIYINAGVSTNPATLLGFGTWIAFGAGQVAVGINGSDSSFNTLNQTGGNKDAIVVSHNHTASTNTISDHVHTSYSIDYTGSGSYNVAGDAYRGVLNGRATSAAGSHNHTVAIDSAGGTGANANLQPYIVVCMWKRTA